MWTSGNKKAAPGVTSTEDGKNQHRVSFSMIIAQYRAIDFFAEPAYNIYMIQTPPRLSTMRTMAGSNSFLG